LRSGGVAVFQSCGYANFRMVEKGLSAKELLFRELKKDLLLGGDINEI
jgi:hypothetical protein